MDVVFFQPAICSDSQTRYGAIANGLVALAMYLEEQGLQAKICHLYDTRPEELVFEKLAELRPRTVGINLTWHTGLDSALRIAKLVKQTDPEIPVAVGGPTAACFDREILEYACGDTSQRSIDCVVRGDGELPFLEFVRSGRPPTQNTTFVADDGEVVRTPQRYVQEDLPGVRLGKAMPELVDRWDAYLARTGRRTSVPGLEAEMGHQIAPGEWDLYVGKGCLSNCCYCGGGRDAHHALAERRGVLFRRLEDVAADIDRLIRDGVRRLYASFDPDPSREFYHDLLDLTPSREVDWMFSAWSGPIDSALLDKFAAKYREVEIVVSPDSGSERLRKQLLAAGYGRAPFYTNRELVRFLKEVNRRGMKAMCHFISGLPGERKEDALETDALANLLRDALPEVFIKTYEPSINHNLCAPPLYVEPCSPLHLHPKRFGTGAHLVTFEDYLESSRDPTSRSLLLRHSPIGADTGQEKTHVVPRPRKVPHEPE